jgi:hypothetical protein
MSCEKSIDQFLASLTGDLDDQANAALHAHLAQCAACRESTEGLRALWTNLEHIPQERPSEVVRARFYAMLEAHRHAQSRRGLHLSLNDWLERWWPRQPVMQFGMALLFLGAGLALGPRLRNSHAEIEQLRSEIRSTNQLLAISMLGETSPSERLRGVTWTNKVEQPTTEMLQALLQRLDTDENVNVRLSAVEALGEYRDRPFVRQGLLQSLPRQESPLVQIRIIDLLVQNHERESVDLLESLSNDVMTDKTVRQRAQWGVQQLRF